MIPPPPLAENSNEGHYGNGISEGGNYTPSPFSRTTSAQSLPNPVIPGENLGLYERTLFMLSNDSIYQKEVLYNRV
jgi:hypothetical protein